MTVGSILFSLYIFSMAGSYVLIRAIISQSETVEKHKVHEEMVIMFIPLFNTVNAFLLLGEFFILLHEEKKKKTKLKKTPSFTEIFFGIKAKNDSQYESKKKGEVI